MALKQMDYLDIEEFLRTADESVSVCKDVREKILEEQGRQTLDQDQLRYLEDWGSLSNKFVGAEGTADDNG